MWITASDDAPDKTTFTMTENRSEGWDLEEIPAAADGEDDVISDALLESLESSDI